MSKQGIKFGAIGNLNTDWGDYGHINLFSSSFHGFCYGAACSWNLEYEEEHDNFDNRFSRIEIGDHSGKIAGLMRKISGEMLNWSWLAEWTDPSDEIEQDGLDEITKVRNEILDLDEKALVESHSNIKSLYENLSGYIPAASPKDKLFFRELLCGIKGSSVSHELVMLLKKLSGRNVESTLPSFFEVADRVRRLEKELSELWHLRNKPSEFFRLKLVSLEIANRIDAFGVEEGEG